jgi:hypothetical protein
MRSLRVVAAPVFGITFTSLHSVLVTVIISSVRAAEDILAISAVVVEIRVISKPTVTPGSIERTITSNDYDSALGLSRDAG